MRSTFMLAMIILLGSIEAAQARQQFIPQQVARYELAQQVPVKAPDRLEAPEKSAGAMRHSGKERSAQGGELLTAQMLKSLFPGRFEAVWKDRLKLTIGADADGQLKGYSEGKYDAGEWEIRGNKLCISFSVWTEGDRKCSEVYSDGGWFMGLLSKKGKAHLRFRKR